MINENLNKLDEIADDIANSEFRNIEESKLTEREKILIDIVRELDAAIDSGARKVNNLDNNTYDLSVNVMSILSAFYIKIMSEVASEGNILMVENSALITGKTILKILDKIKSEKGKPNESRIY